MKDLGRRLVVSSISIGCVFCLIFFSMSLWMQHLIPLIIAGLSALAIWEYEQFARAKGVKMIRPAMMAFAFLQTLSFFLAIRFSPLKGLPPILFFVIFLFLFALHFRAKEGAIVDLSVSSFSLLYLAIPLGMMGAILYFPQTQDGRWWVAYLLVVTKITDIGAYFAGSLWGRRKLALHISPGKTVEGAVFGFICAFAASFGFHRLSLYLGDPRFQLGTMEWICLGALLGLTSQFGDLSESLLKRDANKKDSNALPGVGGVLDIIDSLLFNAPIVYFYLNYIKI
jgi:phosphatidate cytidylyltransferase